MNKRTKTIILSLCLLFPLLAAAQNYGSYKLYALYNFNTNASDVQSNTNMQLANGATITTDATRGQVVTFDVAQKGYALFNPAPIVGDTISIAFWYKRLSSDTSGPWKQIFEFHNPADDSNIYLMPVDGWDASRSHLVCDTKSFYSPIYESLPGSRIDANDTWHHIVVVISGKKWSYYLDGNLQQEKEIFGSISLQNPERLYFGCNPNRGDYPMSSSMDDISIYHYPLSASQVTQLYAGEPLTDPVVEVVEDPITFHLDGNLDEANNKLNLSGTGYTFQNDNNRGEVVALAAGGQLNFSAAPFPEKSSTVNFLYKKESFTEADNGKYIYQCSNGSNGNYGLRLKVTGTDAVLELVTTVSGTESVKTGSKNLKTNEWNAISIFHSIAAGNDKGTMRIYQNAEQTAAAANVQTYALNLNKWSIGAATAGESAGGLYDEIVIQAYAMTMTEITAYYTSNTTSVDIYVDVANKKQTIRNIGASDAWNSQMIGLYWPDEKKEKLAELLFSKEFDEDGNPKGIGLSCWRFNIGSGSAEQGEESLINREAGRTECFLNADLTTYDWTKQGGQQWFLNKAVKDYEVENIVGFMNSPPVYFNRDNKAFNKSGAWTYILQADRYDDFAKFTADVVEHFESEGIHFDYISPVNEPQYQWNAGSDGTTSQEGSPATNTEIANVVKAMSSEFSSRSLSTEIFIGEAGSISGAKPQVPLFWGDSDATLKVSNLPNVAFAVSAHSYWNDGSPQSMVNERVSFREELNKVSSELEFFQTEYSLLGEGYTWGHTGGEIGNLSEMETSISLARMLHVDFVVANVTAWHWWTTFEQTKHSGESRFALIEALTKKDKSDGIYNDCKLLYTLGQYSRFIRPGMKRVEVSRSDNMTETDALSNQMFSAYINEETNQVVIIATNSSYGESNIRLNISNRSSEGGELEFTPYVTTRGDEYNMAVQDKIKAGEKFVMPALSVVTFVSGELPPPTGVEAPKETASLNIYPNPVSNTVNIQSEDAISKVTVVDLQGKMLQQAVFNNANECSLDVSALANGLYILKVETGKGNLSEKILKK